MDSYQLYKSLYDRELKRRYDLDAAINLPLTLLSIIVAANSYFVKESVWLDCSAKFIAQTILIFITAICLGVSIYFLTRSLNNFFKGFAYRNLGLTTEIRKYEKDLQNYNDKMIDIEKKISFENIIIDKLTNVIDDHIIFNDKRSYDLYSAKTFLIVCIMLTIINFIIFSLKFINV
jgi:hypothetical protein